MTIAERFAAALAAEDEPGRDGPELLPVRLAGACATALAVDGASLSMVDGAGRRVPLGASGVQADTAERLQFTAGSGPCTAAQQSQQPVFAQAADLQQRWPAFADLLFGATSFRGVVALPLQPALTGQGAVNLFFEDTGSVPGLDVFDAMAVGDLVASALSDAAVWSTWTPDEGPDWLHGPAPRRRATVWEAMGTVAADLEVSAPTALDLLRAAAYGSGRTVEDLADDVLGGRLPTGELRLPG